MKILVIEDERRAAEYLRQGLTENGYTVDVALTGADGLHQAMMGDHELVILDVMLHGVAQSATAPFVPASASNSAPRNLRCSRSWCSGLAK